MFYKYLNKMNQITEYIAEINTRYYKHQGKYSKNLLTHTILAVLYFLKSYM